MADIPSRRSSIITQRFTVIGNTFKRAVTDNPRDKIEIEIGDSKQPDFKPQVKISRWFNEVNFSLRAQEHPEAIVRTEGKVIKYITPDYEVHQYELDPGEIGEDGGLEFEWVLPQKPASNVLTATIQTKELNFFYQPALTQEEIDEGASRPENVVGSYAVYHKTKGGMNRADGMEYKTGKAFHIYRPKVTDNKGDETWAELNIDEANGVLSVTVPQEFLDKAVYPVIVDPTFGYTSTGASTENLGSSPDGLIALFTLSEDGDVSKLTAYQYEAGAGTNTVTGVIYDNDGTGGAGGTRMGAANETIISSTTPAWYDHTFGSAVALTAGDWWLGVLAFDAGTITYYDTGTGSWQEDGDIAYPTQDPWDFTTISSSRIFSIYATYTTAKIETLTDNFNDNSINTTLWNDDNASETGGQMVVTANTSSGTYNGTASDSRYDLTASSAFIELVNAGDTSLSFTTYILELYNDTVDLYWAIEYGATDEIVAYKSPDSVNYTEIYRATYDSSVHKWFRIREASGTVYWDTSVDGTSWTNRDSDATGYDLTALNVFFGVENPASGSTTVTFDNFNVAPAITTLSPSVSDSSTITESVTVSVEALATPSPSVSDSSTITESISVSIQALAPLTISVSDSATITDSLPAYSQTEQATITESIGVDINAAIDNLEINVSDSATITESVDVDISNATDINISVSDSAIISDSLSYTDDFNRANSNDIGSQWWAGNHLDLNQASNFKILDNELTCQAEQYSNDAIYLSPINSDSSYVEVTEATTFTGNERLSLYIRSQDTQAQDTYLASFRCATSDVLLYRRIAGTSTPIFDGTISHSYAAGDRLRFEVYNNGSGNPVLTAYANGVSLGSYTDEHADKITTTGYAGVRLSTGTEVVDDWEAGPVAQVFVDVSDPQIAVSDSATITESLNVALQTGDIQISVSDSATITDSLPAYSQVEQATITESVGLSIETPVAPDDIDITVSDSSTITESLSVDVSDPQIAVSDSASISESVGVLVSTLDTPQPVVSDTITIAENVGVVVSDPQVVASESASITESVSVSVEAIVDRSVIVSETTAISESVTVVVSDPQIAVSDSATITESVSVSVGGRYSKNDRLGLDIGSGLSIPLGPQRMATWGTNARPANAVNGMIGYNTELQQVELYQEGAWYKLEATPL